MIHVNLSYLEPYGVKIGSLERDLYVRNRYLWDSLNLNMTKALVEAPELETSRKIYGNLAFLKP